MTKEESKPVEEQEEVQNQEENAQEEKAAELSPEDKINELNDKYLRLYSEFDNFRRRTAKERLDLLRNASEELMQELLPIMDDFDRAAKAMADSDDISSIKQGVELVHHKFKSTLENKGLKKFRVVGKAFDPDFHEAVTKIPAPKKKLKGKVVDVIEEGYMINDKVLRYAKVVVGE
ncbi:MAG: nucleotide exchange factor GrpE [Bacteroidia bacterium]